MHTGAELDTLSDKQLEDIVGHAAVFARVTPEHKLCRGHRGGYGHRRHVGRQGQRLAANAGPLGAERGIRVRLLVNLLAFSAIRARSLCRNAQLVQFRRFWLTVEMKFRARGPASVLG